MSPPDDGSAFMPASPVGATGSSLNEVHDGPASPPRAAVRASEVGHEGPKSYQDRFIVDRRILVAAIVAEVVLGAGQWYGGHLLADTYGHDRQNDFLMMMISPTVLLPLEAMRVYLTLIFRTHERRWVRALALVLTLAFCFITIKTSSQIFEQMYRPRLKDFRTAHLVLTIAQSELEAHRGQIRQAENNLQRAIGRETAARESWDGAAKAYAALPPPKCGPTVWYDRDGRERRGWQCTPDARGPALKAAMEATKDAYDGAAKARASMAERLEELVPATPDKLAGIDRAVEGRTRALMESQIHSFIGMIMRKDPFDVTEAEIHQMLLLFVFLPAVVISLLGFALVCGAVHEKPPSRIQIDRRTAKAIAKFMRDREF